MINLLCVYPFGKHPNLSLGRKLGLGPERNLLLIPNFRNTVMTGRRLGPALELGRLIQQRVQLGTENGIFRLAKGEKAEDKRRRNHLQGFVTR